MHATTIGNDVFIYRSSTTFNLGNVVFVEGLDKDTQCKVVGIVTYLYDRPSYLIQYTSKSGAINRDWFSAEFLSKWTVAQQEPQPSRDWGEGSAMSGGLFIEAGAVCGGFTGLSLAIRGARL